MTVQTALLQGAEMLEQATVGAARLTAEVLLCHALHCDRAWIFAHGSDELPERAWIHYGRYLNERLSGKPTQYITGRQEFYGRDFHVDARVLIPRPETEHLVEAAVAYLRTHSVSTVLDIGTGSGAIAISVALETGRAVIATDISPDALCVAAKNRDRLHAPVQFVAADLGSPVRAHSVDLLLSNPPYVPGADSANMQIEVRDWEPHVALFAGDSGLEIYRRLLDDAERILVSGGRLLMELGYQSLTPVQQMLADRWTDVQVVADLAGWPRVLGARLAP